MRLLDTLIWRCPNLVDGKQENRIKSEHALLISKITTKQEQTALNIIKENRDIYNKAVIYRGNINNYFITKYSTPKKLRQIVMLRYKHGAEMVSTDA